jgi:tetratricopeptide (TPR) repeat protein
LGDLAASTAAYERVLAIDPKDAEALADVGFNQSALGRLTDARRSLSRAWALAPDSNYNAGLESTILSLSGDVDATWRRYEELRGQAGLNPTYVDIYFPDVNTLRDPARLEALATRLAGEPTSANSGSIAVFYRAVALDRLGRRAEALALAQDLKARLALGASTVNAGGNDTIRTLAVALDAFLGNTSAAHAGAAALKKDPPRDRDWVVGTAPFFLIDAYARLGQPEAAFDLVEQGMDEFSPIHFVHMKNNVAFDAYRELPRYRALNARYEAWKAAQPPAG